MTLKVASILERIRTLSVPIDGSKPKVYFLGFLNFFAFGFGTIISGIIDGSIEDVIIGMLQFLPFIGWMWSIVWGFLMITRRFKRDRANSKTVSLLRAEP